MKLIVTNHAARNLKARMGCHRGDAEKIARRAWDAADTPPPEWEVPTVHTRFRYYRYAEFVFVFAPAKTREVRMRFEPDTRFLVTVVGPFGPGVVWQKKDHEAG